MADPKPTEETPARPTRQTEHRDDLSDAKYAQEATITQVQGHVRFHNTVGAVPLDPWSGASIQLYLILLVAALNATTSGFDGSIFSSINAMSQYESYFHHTELGSATGM